MLFHPLHVNCQFDQFPNIWMNEYWDINFLFSARQETSVFLKNHDNLSIGNYYLFAIQRE
jgi:hypothetical protein